MLDRIRIILAVFLFILFGLLVSSQLLFLGGMNEITFAFVLSTFVILYDYIWILLRARHKQPTD